MGTASEEMQSASSAAALRDALERAIGSQTPAGLAYAGTSVAFSTPDGARIVLVLEPGASRVTSAPVAAEIEIALEHDQARAYAMGRFPLGRAVVSGAVGTSGPVRRYLELDPVIRNMLAAISQGRDGGKSFVCEAPDVGSLSGAIDTDLLAIETCGLHKSFGNHQVLRGLDLTIPEGMISVILGPSGTGKSVCLQQVIGLTRPDAGDIVIRGRALSTMSRAEVLGLRRAIGVMFQDGALFSAMNVFENVAFPLRQHTSLGESDIVEIVTEHLDAVGLGGAGRRMPNELSGGMRKRAGLARALVLNPGIVLVDEPDSGLDPVRTALLGELLVQRHADLGGTMVVVTHNVSLARNIADYVSVLWQGRVLESGFTEQILASDTPFVEQFLAGQADGPLTMDA